MKDKAIGVGLVLGIALVIALVSWVGHQLGDPSYIGLVVTALVSVLGLTIMWLKETPKPVGPTVAEAVKKAVVAEVEASAKIDTAIAKQVETNAKE